MFRLRETITAQAVVDADRSTVWSVLADVPRYPEWNPQVVRWEGVLAPGERTKETIRTSTGREFTFSPRILKVDPGREITQRARTMVPGLFTGTHTFRLQDTPSGACRVTKEERLAGLAVWLLPRRFLDRSAAEFHDALTALAAETERRRRRPPDQ